MSHTAPITKRLVAATALSLAVMFMHTGVASAQTSLQQLAEVKAQLEQMSAQFNTPAQQVLGVATTSTDVIPTCTVTTDKDSYVLGETIVVSWTTKNAKTVLFTSKETKDDLVFPSEKLKKNGTAAINASVVGSPSITLQVTSKTGETSLCGETISISKKGSGEDKEVKKLRKQLEQVQKKIEALSEKYLALQIKELILQVQAEELKAKIAKLTGEPGEDPEKVNSIHTEFIDGDTEKIGDTLIEYTIQFEVTGGDDTDAYLLDGMANGEGQKAYSVYYRIVDGKGNVVNSSTLSSALSSTADEDNGYYIVEEHETEEFFATVSFSPSVSGTYHMEIIEIEWKNGVTGQHNETILNGKVFRTPATSIAVAKG